MQQMVFFCGDELLRSQGFDGALLTSTPGKASFRIGPTFKTKGTISNH